MQTDTIHAEPFELDTSRRDAPDIRAEDRSDARHDMYAGIHKALRLFMGDTVSRLGQCDPRDDAEVAATIGQLGDLLDTCSLHITDENDFVHPALERAKPGFSARIAGEHVEHREAIADLRDLAAFTRTQRGAARTAALSRLYRTFVLFVAENFEHMNHEETEHNALLWASYTDAELLGIERALVASIPADAMMLMVPWFIRSLNAPELAEMMGGMKAGMPAPAFENVMQLAHQLLGPVKYATLTHDLGLPL